MTINTPTVESVSANIFDVAVVGGGPVGAALATALARGGLKVALIEGRQPSSPAEEDTWDARVYAVSPGSREFLLTIGAWQRIAPLRVAAIEAMRVWGDDGRSSIEFEALQAAREDLGCIVEAGRLHEAIWHAAQEEANLHLYCPARCQSLALGDGATSRLTLAGGETIEAALVIGADGPDSWLRDAAGLAATTKPYGETAVVANFATERPHGHVARQWFREDGVLAWLPLPGNRISIVWSMETRIAEELLALDPAVLCARVEAAGHHLLGLLKLITPPAAFPLRLIDLAQTVTHGVALVGDAAHVVHPLAGQGVNLGFRDGRVLADVLLGRRRHEQLGDVALLRRYERARREDWLMTKWLTDGLHALFNPTRRPLAGLRNWGLGATNRLPILKRRFMVHAMR